MNPRANRNRPGEEEKRRAMYQREAGERAALLRRLGHTAKQTEARLRANLDWEFETGPGGRPGGLTDAEIAKVVKAAFKR